MIDTASTLYAREHSVGAALRGPRTNASFFRPLLELIGAPLDPCAQILDFGCGDGVLVEQLSAAGMDAYGCDFPDELGSGKTLRAIGAPFGLPFPDDSFDAVVSWQVFEHVQNYDDALREIRRVLRPSGVSLHVFPPTYRPIEPHIYVPLAIILQSRLWLLLWTRLGIRKGFQKGTSAREVAGLNRRYLRERTTYYPAREVLRRARDVFPNARLLTLEPLAVSPSARGQRLYALARDIPTLASPRAAFSSRASLL